MEGAWEAVKIAFSGIFNWGTLIGMFAGITVYAWVCIIITYLENKEYTMRLFALLQLWLGNIRNQWARNTARWLWVRIIRLDYERRCQLAVESANERNWHLKQFTNFGYDKKIANTCRIFMSKAAVSENVAKRKQEWCTWVEALSYIALYSKKDKERCLALRNLSKVGDERSFARVKQVVDHVLCDDVSSYKVKEVAQLTLGQLQKR